MSSIIEVIHSGKETYSFNETINETIELEPMALVFGVLSGIIVGSLLWYFGLA